MKHEYTKTTAQQRSTIIAALRYWQDTVTDKLFKYGTPHKYQAFFTEHEPLDHHQIDKLCDELGYPVAVDESIDLEKTQDLPDPTDRRKFRRAYLHVQSLYGEVVLMDVLENVRNGMKILLRSEDLKALAYSAAALELMRTPVAKSAKLTIERMMVQIYDHREVEVTALHVPALELGELAMRAITENTNKYIRRMSHVSANPT